MTAHHTGSRKLGTPVTGCKSIGSMCERITEELVKLYCLLQPGKSAREDGTRDLGWSHAASAQYFLGRAEALLVLEPVLAHANTERGKAGSTKRDAKFEPLRKLARELASKKRYPSKRNAALSIKDEILAAAKVHEITLSAMQAERTITGWLDGMSFGSKQ